MTRWRPELLEHYRPRERAAVDAYLDRLLALPDLPIPPWAIEPCARAMARGMTSAASEPAPASAPAQISLSPKIKTPGRRPC